MGIGALLCLALARLQVLQHHKAPPHHKLLSGMGRSQRIFMRKCRPEAQPTPAGCSLGLVMYASREHPAEKVAAIVVANLLQPPNNYIPH